MIYGVGVRLTSGCIARSGARVPGPTFLLSHSLTDADTWVQSEPDKCFYYHVTTQTDLLCYQPYQLLAQLRAKEAQNCRRYNWLMMRKLMGKFYFLITRIIRSAETRSFRRNFKIYTQHSQIF